MDKEDVLQRKAFVEKVLKIIQLKKEQNASFSFSINGEWGCGKTFVLDMIEERLLEGNYLPFYYDAWKYDYYDEPLVSIISFLAQTIKKHKFSYLSENEENILNGFAEMLFQVTEHFTGINPKKVVDEATKPQEESYDKNLSLCTAIETVNSELQKLAKTFTVVIIVDELDRCLPEYAIKVLERLHHICEKSRAITLVAYDKTQLADGIAKIYGKNFEHGNINVLSFADSYLRKFFKCELLLDNGKADDNVPQIFQIYDDMSPSDLIPTSFLKKFLDFLHSFFDERTLEHFVEKAQIIHTISKDKESNEDYALLCAELLAVILYVEFKLPVQVIDFKEKVEARYCYPIISEIGTYNENISNFLVSFSNFFKVDISYTIGNGHGAIVGFNRESPETVILSFFMQIDSVSSIYEKDSSILDSRRNLAWEREFFQQKFLPNLDILK